MYPTVKGVESASSVWVGGRPPPLYTSPTPGLASPSRRPARLTPRGTVPSTLEGAESQDLTLEVCGLRVVNRYKKKNGVSFRPRLHPRVTDRPNVNRRNKSLSSTSVFPLNFPFWTHSFSPRPFPLKGIPTGTPPSNCTPPTHLLVFLPLYSSVRDSSVRPLLVGSRVCNGERGDPGTRGTSEIIE